MYVDNKIVNIMVSRCNLYQSTDWSGKPNSIPLGGLFEITFESDSDTLFFEWMISEDMMKEVKLIFSPVTMNAKSRTILLYDTHCIKYEEHFSSTTDKPITTTLILSPGIIVENNEILLKKPWKISDPFIKKAAPTSIPVEKKKKKKKDFDITIKYLKTKKTLFPLGIPTYKGTQENKFIEFEIEVLKNAIENFEIQILNDGSTVYTIRSGEDGMPSSYRVGKHTFKWDGFDISGKYDSKVFSKGKFKAKVTGSLEGVEKTAKSEEFLFKRTKEKWVDAVIDKVSKRIDITLRVNLRDGGEKGTEKDCNSVGSGSYASERTVCPWDKIPEEVIKNNLEPIKTRTKSFEELKEMALEGINTYWSRRFTNTDGTLADGTNYEVIVNAVQDENGMDDVELIYNTNNSWLRSGNPGTVEDPISFFGNVISREAICYNAGYIKYSNGWNYEKMDNEDKEFKETSAHEIGHTILKAYGGTNYSYGHKGSVNTITQSENSNATDFPKDGEIDLMKYYRNWIPYNQRNSCC